jgi:hypothetical protein
MTTFFFGVYIVCTIFLVDFLLFTRPLEIPVVKQYRRQCCESDPDPIYQFHTDADPDFLFDAGLEASPDLSFILCGSGSDFLS